VAVLTLLGGCRCEGEREQPAGSGGTVAPAVIAPRQLYIPDSGAAGSRPRRPSAPDRQCPADMVDVAGEFCIDRYEAYLVEHIDERPLSPFYHPTRERTQSSYEHWTRPQPNPAPFLGPLGPPVPEIPVPPAWQLRGDFRPRAQNKPGLRPQGYLSGEVAREACANAGKRLCSENEWVRACRGELDWDYPYGDEYEAGVCNIARKAHPAFILHGNASDGHRDPRLNLVEDGAGPLLRVTGSLPRCKSRWGDDAIYDMVGNLDEWIDDETGVFVGGFYSRQTEAGCAARVGAHAFEYFDYSLGVRCCT
jgi:formylglycine-generating enzyme